MIYHGDALIYIEETPDILGCVFRNRKSILRNALTLLERNSVRELLIIGTGSSYNAGYAVRNFLQQILKKRVSVIYPSELQETILVCNCNTVVIGISQQGTSTSVIEAIDRAKLFGKKTIAMTGEANTELEKHGDVLLPIECREEDTGVTTKGFTVTAFTLLLLGLEMMENTFKKEEQIWKEKLCAISSNIQKILEEKKSQMNDVVKKLCSFEQLTIISDTYFCDLMPEIVLKFSETCRKPVFGMESEKFCHGMYNVVDEKMTFLFLTYGNDVRIQKLKEYYREHDNMVVEVDASSFGADLTLYFSMLLFLQYVMVNVSRSKKININIPRDPEFHKIMGSKIEENLL